MYHGVTGELWPSYYMKHFYLFMSNVYCTWVLVLPTLSYPGGGMDKQARRRTSRNKQEKEESNKQETKEDNK